MVKGWWHAGTRRSLKKRQDDFASHCDAIQTHSFRKQTAIKACPVLARRDITRTDMSDFFQTGAIATLHRLGKQDVPRMERELREFTKETRIALVLPCHVKELGTPALRGIMRELRSVDYLRQVIVGIDGANPRDWKRARRIFSQLPQKPTLLWNDGPRIRRLYAQLEEADISPGSPGKGRNVWTCLGYVLASDQSQMVA